MKIYDLEKATKHYYRPLLVMMFLVVSTQIALSSGIKGSWNSWSGKNFDGSNVCFIYLDGSHDYYELKVYDNNRDYGNSGKITGSISNWNFPGNNSSNCQIKTGNTGYYKFWHYGWKNGYDGNGYYEVNVNYPSGFKIKHNWNNKGWSWQSMTQVGSSAKFRYEGKYSGSNSSDLGFDDSNKANRSDATLKGSPSTGNDCIFLVDAGSIGSTIGEATITIGKKVYSITGTINSGSWGTWNSMTAAGDGTYYYDCTSVGKFKLSDMAEYDEYFYTGLSTASCTGATLTFDSSGSFSGNNNCNVAVSSGYTTPVRIYLNPSTKKVWAVATEVPSCTAPTPTTTDAPTAIGTTTATLTGTYPTTSGYCSITEKGICYGTSSNPTSEHKDNTSGSGSISHSATGLSEGTTYYYRAYVKSGGSTLYGANKSFKTKCTATKPTLSATPPNATNITCSSATLGGQVTNKGQDASCETLDLTYRGVKVYSNSACTDAYLVTTVNHATPNSTAAYTVTVPSGTLSSGTTYYYKSYATNATGTSYSTNYKSFTTKATPSAVDISISSPASATTLYLGTGDYPSVTQTVTASCDKGDTYLWSASPTTYTSSSCWPSTATRVEFTSTSSKSTTATFYHEGVYTATFNAGCGNTSDASKDAQTITVKPGHIYFDGPFFSGSGYDLTKHHLEIDKSNDKFVYEWTATSSNTVAKNDFIISVGSKCLDAASSAYTLGNYADLNLSGLTIPTKSTGEGDNCNHNFRADIGTITVGERLKLTVAYTGVNASGIPKYNVTLEKVCSNPTVQTVSGTATICSGSSTNVTVSSSQSNYTYKLYKDGSATATTQTGTNSALNFPVSDAGTYTVHAYYTSGSDTYCKADMTGSATVTVDATSVAGTITGRSSSQCLGNTRTLTLNTYTGTIQWHVGNASDFTPSSSTAISGATNSTYKAPINEVGTKYYKAVVTNGVCPSATTVTAADITVNRKYQASDFNLSGNTQDYDGNPKTVTVAEKSGAGNGAITIKYAGSTTAPTNAGTYAITIDVDKSSTSPYYCAEEGLSIGTLTINKIDQPHAVTIDNETTSYCVSTLGTDIPLEASGGDGTGAYSFTITGGTVAADKRSISGSTLTVSGAGTVILQATRAADTNYNAKNSATVTFTFTANGPKVFTLTNEGATALCGKGDGSSTGTGGSLRLTGSETGYSYQLKKDDANYGDPVAGTGSALTFPVTSSGVYTCTAYYGADPSQCPTEMNVEDGGIVLVVNITPRLLPGTPTVRQYQAVTITSTNTEIDKWVLSGEGADAYTYDSTPNSITLKANTAGSPYRLIATTSAGCTATAVITVIADTENCVP